MEHNQYITGHKWSSCPGLTRVSTRRNQSNALNSLGKFQISLWWRHMDGRIKPGHDVVFIHYLTTPEPRMSLDEYQRFFLRQHDVTPKS